MRTCAVASASDAKQVTGPLKYQHIMLALVDPSPYFGDGSKQARKAHLSVSVRFQNLPQHSGYEALVLWTRTQHECDSVRSPAGDASIVSSTSLQTHGL